MKNKVITSILLILAIFCGYVNTDAATTTTAPSSITTKSKSNMYYYSEKNGTDYIHGYNFYRKELTDGSFVYCVSNISTDTPSAVTLKLVGVNTDMGLNYIIQNGYPMKSITGDAKKDYYITQSAIWKYFDKTRGSDNWHNFITSSSTGMEKKVYDLVQAAMNARNTSYPTPSISASVASGKMTYSNGNFVSSPVKVTLANTTGTYTVSITSGASGTVIKNASGANQTTFNSGDSFYVYTPNRNEAGSIGIKISAKGMVYKTYTYSSGKSGIQDVMPVPFIESTDIENNLTFSYDKIVTKVKLSKQDLTTKAELPGAKLEIKDSTGKVVTSWTSTAEPHYIENLAAGNYSLCETAAPSGYQLKTECVNFSVNADGTLTTVVMYNSQYVTKAKLSKQDITTKKELPGAKLEVKDSNNKTVASWTSTNEPHYIEGLEPGTYALCEKEAPAGYVLNNTCVAFTVKRDGTTTSAVMYNTPVSKVKISKQDITNNKELPGAKLEVKDSNNKVVASWTSTTEPHYIEGLANGKYTLCETAAPSGYVLSKECVTFEVKNGESTNVIMYNKPVTKVKISKQDITNKEELPGAKLEIKDSNNKVVASWTSTTEPHYIEGLDAGKYTLCETAAPSGYQLKTECIEFTLKNDGKVSSVVMYNSPITKVQISKQDMTTKKELPGAHLTILDSKGKEVASWVSTSEPHYIDELPEGTYTLIETSAPTGYELSEEKIEFTVKEDGKIVSVVMYNTKKDTTKIKISKQDITTGQELPGAHLVIKDENGKVIDEWVSSDTPHYIAGLPVGKYTLSETIAPDGYQLTTETIEFEVVNDGLLKEVIMYNRPLTPVPITDMNVSQTLILFASLMTILGLGVVVYRVKFQG